MLQVAKMLFLDGIVMTDGSHGIPKDVPSLGQLQMFPLITEKLGPVFAFQVANMLRNGRLCDVKFRSSPGIIHVTANAQKCMDTKI